MNSILMYNIKNLSIQTELLEALDWDDSKLDLIGDMIIESDNSKNSISELKKKIISTFDESIWNILYKSIKLEEEFIKNMPEAWNGIL